jgi:sterol desaturase/sphingolipid hydroxylase (fatty acid hydroxylase superfamily)
MPGGNVVNPIKKFVFTAFQPVYLGLLLLFWANVPDSLVHKTWVVTAVSIGTMALVQALEFVNERHAGWRMNLREFLTDCFYLILFFLVVENIESALVEVPLASAKHALGFTTDWAMHLPFVVQVALGFFLIEFGQYWMHRLMHNTFLWWTHAPHHHITQLNAMKGLVGNPIELFLVSLSVIAIFDLPLNAVFCAFNIDGAVAAFAHGNVRFHSPRWYAYIFTTIEHHSLHHSVGFLETRCNYANAMILVDRMFGTFRAGESEVVGQEERKRLAISEQLIFPFRPLIAMIKSSTGKAASNSG